VFTVETSPAWLARARECAPILHDHALIQGELPAILMQSLYQEFRRSDAASSLAIEGLALEMCVALSRQCRNSTARRPARWLHDARELVRARFRENLSLSDVADSVDVHPTHLARVFRQQYGCTVGTYVRRLRIQLACDYLSTSDSSLVEIAMTAGFADQSHFARTFKRMMGVSPSGYRENMRRC
jgi:AraC family transcriptional regulator